MLQVIFKPHRLYLKAHSEEKQRLFVMLGLKPVSELKKADPLHLVFVIDTSGSMHELVSAGSGQTKIEAVIEAAQKLIDDPHLRNEDQVGIVHFDDSAEVLLPLIPLDRQRIKSVLSSLTNYSGSTHMGAGLREARQLLERLPVHTVKRLLLFTDGLAHDESQCLTEADNLADLNIPSLAVGVGAEYNQDLLLTTADRTRGKHVHLSDLSRLEEIFREEVAQAAREVITNVELQLRTVRGMTLQGIHRVYPNLVEISRDTTPYHLGNLAANDITVFLLDFEIAGSRPPSRARLVEIEIQAHAAGRPVRVPPQELYINFTTDEQLYSQVDAEVLDYVQQRNVTNLVQQAVQQAARGQTQLAHQTLRAAQGLTQRLNNAGVTRLLQQAETELQRTGSLSDATQRTLRAEARTRTMRSMRTMGETGGLSEEEIRRATGA